MAINLLGNNINNIQNGMTQAETSVKTENGASLIRQAATAMLNELRNIMPGDTISGQLVSKDGNSIQLLLNNSTLLNTSLDNDVNIAMGQQISFEVRSNQNGQLTLRPMFTNLNNSSTITNALNAANIGVSDTTVSMVDTLMQNGMPIGKDILNTINRELSMYPEADVKDIVMLHKMDIPVNSSNVNQMHLYNNNNQWMMENVTDAAGELTDMLMDAIGAGDADAFNMINELSECLKPAIQDSNVQAMQLTVSEDVQADNTTGLAQGDQTENANAIRVSVDDSEIISVQNSEESAEQTDSAVRDTNAVNNGTISELEQSGKNESDTTNRGTVGKENGDINKYNIFDKLSSMDKADVSDPAIKEQIRSSLKELMKDNFLMNPKDIGEEKYVKKYYEHTMDLADNISRILAENGKADTPIAHTMNNVKENTSFINQINELYNYVQLPLKMNDSQANGDLYVYARKKGRGAAGEDGKLTALLHLSMEYLGNMDIFLTLQEGQKLSTKFCLEEESMIDFIAGHLDELNMRLAAKGYDVGTTVVTKNDGPEKNVIENITSNDGSGILLSTQSFDARA